MLSKDDIILYCNIGFSEIVHSPMEKIIGINVKNLVSSDHAQELEDLLSRTRRGRKAFTQEISLRTSDGGSVPTLISANLSQTSDSTSTFLVVTDLTEHMEEEVREYTLKLEALVKERTAKLEEALESESRSKREALLLQDILTHDIRNYSQVTKLGAELLAEELRGNAEVELIIQNQLSSLEAMMELLEKAKKLGKVVAETKPNLHSVDLVKIIEEAMRLIRSGDSSKNIDHLINLGSQNSHPFVIADELLIDVFLNLYSNSVKYTEAKAVLIETTIEEVPITDGVNTGSYLKISVIDNSRGIPDDLKTHVFSRFLRGAKGSGLGMSIVHALVVDRYCGKLAVKDKTYGDYTKGTRIEVLLPKA